MVNVARLAAGVIARDYVPSLDAGLALSDKSFALGNVGAFILVPFKKFCRFNSDGRCVSRASLIGCLSKSRAWGKAGDGWN